MSSVERLVLDTNVVLSGLLFPGSVSNSALLKAQTGEILASDATLLELIEVMNRARFDRYVERSLRQRLVAEYIHACVTVPILYPIRACRDPKDDKFLEASVHGRADILLTGDHDLITLHPFRGIAIMSPAEYVNRALS